MTNGGLTETLFHILRRIQTVLLTFEGQDSANASDLTLAKELLASKPETNEILTLTEIYIGTAFELIRQDALQVIQGYFDKMNRYYNMLFGLFVSLLSLFQLAVTFILVKKLSKQIIMIYHVVLLIPFSGRTQNDLNLLMMIKM